MAIETMQDIENAWGIEQLEDQEREAHRIRSWGMQHNKQTRNQINEKSLPTAEQILEELK
jgi:hypothetical protein